MEPKQTVRLEKIDAQIQAIKKAALEMKNISGGIQALDCNIQRILASVKMLEINFSDLRELDASGRGASNPMPLT
ncbi:MAG: hypothetical protein HY892_18745 [Deltaproteobacteria bacterium]|nr:hypothetical protein [Deltaproteobacteria bacterium]